MECWFCGSIRCVEEWHEGGRSMPMCCNHSCVVRVALRLRELGEEQYADALDCAIGIETRPMFCKWSPPAAGQWEGPAPHRATCAGTQLETASVR